MISLPWPYLRVCTYTPYINTQKHKHTHFLKSKLYFTRSLGTYLLCDYLELKYFLKPGFKF